MIGKNKVAHNCEVDEKETQFWWYTFISNIWRVGHVFLINRVAEYIEN